MENYKIENFVGSLLNDEELSQHDLMKKINNSNWTTEEKYQIIKTYETRREKVKRKETRAILKKFEDKRKSRESKDNIYENIRKLSIVLFGFICILAPIFGLNDVKVITTFVLSALLVAFFSRKSKLAIMFSLMTFGLIYLPTLNYYLHLINRGTVFKIEGAIPGLVAIIPSLMVYNLLKKE